MLKSMADHVSGRQVRDRKQTTIRFEIVQPGRPHHLESLRLGSFDMLEEGGQVCQSLLEAINC